MSNKIGIKPLRDKVVVERDEAKDTTAGGLVIPQSAKEKPMKGTVRAAGPGTKEEPMMVKPGDKVLYSKHSGIDITVDGESFLIMREQEILAIIN